MTIAGRPLSADDFVVLNDEIRAFVRAGIPLDVGLSGTSSRTRGALSEFSEQLSRKISRGMPLEQALADEDHRLPGAYRAVLVAGFKTGRIDEVLSSLSELAESTTAMRRQLRLSLIYPAAVITFAYGLFTAYLTYVVPHVERTYVLFDLAPSRWIRTMYWLHRTVGIWGVAVPAIVLGLIVLVALWRRVTGRGGTDFLLSGWLPGSRELALSRFSRVLSLLVAYGVPLPEACRLGGESSGDGRIVEATRQLATTIESGHTLEEATRSAPWMPAFLKWLIVVGERQGSLAASLKQAANVYEQRALTRLDWFRRVVPPAIVILCCGSITLMYGLTLFLPLSDLLDQLGRG